MLNELFAQQKYEYASIAFSINTPKLSITDDKGYNVIEFSKDDRKSVWDMAPVFRQIKKMEDEGWELYDTQVSGEAGQNLVFFLRKKRS